MPTFLIGDSLLMPQCVWFFLDSNSEAVQVWIQTFELLVLSNTKQLIFNCFQRFSPLFQAGLQPSCSCGVLLLWPQTAQSSEVLRKSSSKLNNDNHQVSISSIDIFARREDGQPPKVPNYPLTISKVLLKIIKCSLNVALARFLCSCPQTRVQHVF